MTRECYQAASAALDHANAEDPNRELADGRITLKNCSHRRFETVAGNIKLPEALVPQILKAAQ